MKSSATVPRRLILSLTRSTAGTGVTARLSPTNFIAKRSPISFERYFLSVKPNKPTFSPSIEGSGFTLWRWRGEGFERIFSPGQPVYY